jgi:DNA-binding LacI/PurR family transcriptional regulator
LYAGALERAAERHYRLEHFWLYQDGMSNRRFGEVLQARGIPGILLAPIPSTRIKVALPWSAFSVMVLGLTPSVKQFHRVTTDYYQSMQLAYAECIARGYRRPGLAVRMETIERLEYRWEAAYLLAQKASGEPGPPAPLLVGEWDADTVLRWLDREKPDVVIGPVIGKLEKIIRASGRRIPEDIGMIGLVVQEESDWLSGILQDGEIIGAVALDLLIGLIERNETGVPAHPITHTMPGRWNPGQTLQVKG